MNPETTNNSDPLQDNK